MSPKKTAAKLTFFNKYKHLIIKCVLIKVVEFSQKKAGKSRFDMVFDYRVGRIAYSPCKRQKR